MVLRASLAVCIVRCQHRIEQGLEEVSGIEQLWRSFASLGELEGQVIHSGRVQATELARLIQEDLDQFLVGRPHR